MQSILLHIDKLNTTEEAPCKLHPEKAEQLRYKHCRTEPRNNTSKRKDVFLSGINKVNAQKIILSFRL